MYETMVREQERLPKPLSPMAALPPTPPRQPSPPKWSPGVSPTRATMPSIPERFETMEPVKKTPPYRIRITREEFPEALEFIEEPIFEDDFLYGPPTPPSPLEYQSPELMPLSDSPPIQGLVAAHEYTDDFFDPRRPRLRTSVMRRGRRVPVRRHSQGPPLSPVEEIVEAFQSPPIDYAAERRYEKATSRYKQIFPDPAPPPPREARSMKPGVCPGTKGVISETIPCKKSGLPMPASSKSRLPQASMLKTPRSYGSKTGLKIPQPSASKSKLKTPKPTTSKSMLKPPSGSKFGATPGKGVLPAKTPSGSRIAIPKGSGIAVPSGRAPPSAKTPSASRIAVPGGRAATPKPSVPDKPLRRPSPRLKSRAPYGPLTRAQHHFVQSFEDPEHRELFSRVLRLVADVGEPFLDSPPPEREFEDIGGLDDIAMFPPPDAPSEEELPPLTPPIPEFRFQSDVGDFIPELAGYRVPPPAFSPPIR